ncbi:hypothetical protein EDB80DRAFT_759873 [Ilyonectria destructans]|nr:hypothetical protein EDB80DRAFT_759873 [Ilyonectria destructans]
MSREPTKTCIFFMDNSNIWIRAQKFAASGNGNMPKLRDGDSDPRLRIKIDKLVDTLRKDRFQAPSFLYGSGPPSDASVWDEYSKLNFQPKIYGRFHGAEKEVDTSMATDLGYEAAKLTFEAKPWNVRQQKANTTFIITTGDRDMLPPVKKVLDCGIRVELWAWKSGVSSDYLKLQSQNTLLSVRYLDCLFEDISFMNFHSTRNTDEFDPGKTIILCCSDKLRREDLESSICKQLVDFRYLFYITISKTEEEIIVEFPGIKSIEDIIVKVRDLFKEILTVLSWPEYASRLNEKPPAMLEDSNRYALLVDEDGHEPVESKAKSHSSTERQGGHGGNDEVQRLNDADKNDDGPWQIVTRSDPRAAHRRSTRQTQQCAEGIRCKKRGDCGSQHSDQERKMFQEYPDRDFRWWKTRKCQFKKDCNRGREWCRCEGHFPTECPYRR